MKKSILLALVLVAVLTGCTLAGGGDKATVIGLEAAKAKATDFINNNLLQPGTTATVKEATEEAGLYKLVVTLSSGQEITSYLSKDGQKFFPNVYDIAEIEKQAEAKDAEGAAAEAGSLSEIPKKDKATAELYVMAFCPYGVQAEAAMAPVVDLLGVKADIQVRFIASVSGDDINAVKSLHGAVEGIEDARQLCVAKNYDQATLWDYIGRINKDCYPIYRNGDDAYKACWQKAAKDAGVSTSKLDACIAGEGVALIQKEDASAKAYGVTGSPTLIVNGVKYNGGRTPDAYKQAVCAGFTTPPAECEETLSTDGGTADGGC